MGLDKAVNFGLIKHHKPQESSQLRAVNVGVTVKNVTGGKVGANSRPDRTGPGELEKNNLSGHPVHPKL
jgi:hypothetical protein